MVDSTASESPLETAAGTGGPNAVDAFELLSDETRLAILLALREAYDPHAENDAVSFSTLYDRVSQPDSGTFTYHLDKLVGHFVEETDDGYRLRNSGHTIVRAIIAGTGLEDARLAPTEIPRSCYECGAPVELSYEDERLYQTWTEVKALSAPIPPNVPRPEPSSPTITSTLPAWSTGRPRRCWWRVRSSSTER